MSEQVLHIWDPFIRLFHWCIAGLFFINYFVTDASGKTHEILGYVVLVLLILRLLWGLVGPFNARFSSFSPTPNKIRTHLANFKLSHFNPAEGHNPIGGAMILFLLLGLFVCCMSGWMLEWEIFWGEEWLESSHELSALLVLLAVMIHIPAVLIISKVTGYNLVMTMITGNRKIKSDNDTQG